MFKTKNNEFVILGKTITDIKEKWNDFKEKIVENNGKLFGKDGAFASLFSGKKNNVLPPEILQQFENFKEKFNSSSLSAKALAEQMENVDQRIIDYAKTCKNGEMTTEGFKASVEGMTFSAKAGTAALKGLAIAGNMVAIWVISKGIELVVKGIDNLIHHSEKEKEKLKEIRQQTHESVEAYKQEQADLDSTIEKYKDLNEQLTNASLTTEEYNSIKEQLSSLQDDLVSKYGQEASAIDIVNGKYDEQIKKLDAISRKKAQDFVNTNFSNIQEDWNFLNNTQSIKKQRHISSENASNYNKYLQGLSGRINL